MLSSSNSILRADVLTILATIISLLIWLIRATRQTRGRSSPPLPPGPLGFPLVGYLPILGTDPYRAFTKLAAVYGPIYKLRLGTKLCIVISSPEIMKEVLRDNDTIFANRDPPITAIPTLYGPSDVVLTNYGPQWKKLRKIFVRDMLGNVTLNNCFSLLSKQEVDKSIRQVYDQIGTPIDVGELSFQTVLRSIISMIWGGGEGTMGEKEKENYKKFREAVGELAMLIGKPNVSDFFPVLARFDIQGLYRKAKKTAQVFDMIFYDVIEQQKARGKGEQSKGFLQFLLDFMENEDGENSINCDQLKGMLVDFVVAGTETTSSTIEWTITELIKNPEIMRKVQEELTEIVGLNNLVEDFHLPELHYLSATIKETLRLHPPLPMLVPHSPSQCSTIGGYTIPKNTQILLNILTIHRNPTLWDDPLEYKPERFLDNFRKFDYTGNSFLFLPFGCGRRICAGIPLAERMLMYMLATLLHDFKWTLPHGVELSVKEKFGFAIRKLESLVAIPAPRLSNVGLYGPNKWG